MMDGSGMHFGDIKTLYGLYLCISIHPSTSSPLHLKVSLKILSIWPNELDKYFLLIYLYYITIYSRKCLRRKEKLNNFLSYFPGKLRSLNCLFGRCADEVSVMTYSVTLITFLLHRKFQVWNVIVFWVTAIYDIRTMYTYTCSDNSCDQKID